MYRTILKNIFAACIVSLTTLILISGCEPEKTSATAATQIAIEPYEDINTIEPNIPNEPASVVTVEPNDAVYSPQATIEIEPNVIAEPNVEAEPVLQTQPKEMDKFNIKFASIFSEYVDDNGNVNYRELRRKRLELKKLLDEIATLEPKVYQSWPVAEKIAFWINVYNLKMLDIIVDNYPITSSRIYRLFWPPSSIRHIPPRNLVGAPKWNSYKFIVMDEEFTLTAIEKRFFRKEFRDPRVFLALSLASRDSPPLRNEPYLGSTLEEQLEDQCRRFLNSPSGLRIDRERNRVYLSVIFEPSQPWYGSEFLAKYATDKKFKSQMPVIRAVLNFATQYLPQPSVDYLLTGNYEVRFKVYDWRLNEQ